MVKIDNLRVHFDTPRGPVRAVKGVSLAIPPGGRTALLGESGCGKTVIALALMRLLPRNARVSGSVTIDGKSLADDEHAVSLRGDVVSLSWSNAERFFNPVTRIGDQLAEAYEMHHPGEGKAARQRAMALLERLGFEDSERVARSFPFQLSGGMNQRAMVAMSLINDPSLLIVDEPTRGLDDDNRDRIIEMIGRLSDTTLLVITHDVECARHLAGEAAIMRDGAIVDYGPVTRLLTEPEHPYTRSLVHACPSSWGSWLTADRATPSTVEREV